MPADFERQMSDRLSRLGDETAGAQWSSAEAVRRRGDRRSRNHAVAASTAALLVIGSLGYGVLGGPMPGQDTSSDVAVVDPDQNKGAATSPTSSGPGQGSAPDEDTDSSAPNTEPTTSAPGSADETDEDTSSGSTPTDSQTPSADDSDDPSGNPSGGGTASTSPTDEGTSAVLTASDDMLLSAQEMPYVNDTRNWSTAGSSDDLGECASGSMQDLGATDVTGRAYTWSTDVSGDHIAGTFGSEQEAADGTTEYASWVDNCSWGTPNPPREVQVDEGTAEYWLIGNDEGSEPQTLATAVVHRNQAVAVLTVLAPGQEGPSGMEDAVRSAYDRLPE